MPDAAVPDAIELAPPARTRELPVAPVDAGEVERVAVPATVHEGPTTVRGVLERWSARSMVVLHRGRIVLDWRADGIDPRRQQRCFSVTKSMTGTLAALAVHDGTLDRSARVADVLPELEGSGVGDALVADVADMTTSIAYDEDYAGMAGGSSAGPRRGFGDYVVALGAEEPGTVVPVDAARSVRSFVATLARGAEPHGRALAYATPVADLLGWLLERSTGRSWAEQFAARLWEPSGAEHRARVTVDPEGTPTVGGGLAVTTADLARLGLAIADPDVVPVAVRERIRQGGDADSFDRGGFPHLAGYTYRDQWWLPGGTGRPLSAWGIYGQVLWIDPDAEVVVAVHCGGSVPSSPARDLAEDAMCRALVAASDGWA